MHGRPRIPKNFEISPEAQAALDRKTKLLREATNQVLARRKERRYDEESLGLAAKLLTLNPEIYTVWNFRREALGKVLDSPDKPVEEKQKLCEGELRLTVEALKRNPKSYSAWHQRRWIISKGFCSIDKEFAFIEQKLDEDARNFHAWNYRQFLATYSGRSHEQELMYSEKKIEQNFSNFSAWHYRTRYLPLVHKEVKTVTLKDLLKEGGEKPAKDDVVCVPMDVLEKEFETVHAAFATDAEDSSTWFYYRWLLGNCLLYVEKVTGAPDEAQALERLDELLDREIHRLENEQLSFDPNAKWPLLTIARLKEAKMVGKEDSEGLKAEVRDMYEKLKSVDVQRKGYYEDALQGKASVVLKSIGASPSV